MSQSGVVNSQPIFQEAITGQQRPVKFMDVSQTSLSVLNTAVAFMYNIDYNIEDDNVIELLKLTTAFIILRMAMRWQ